jgi:hypothetical protein
MANRINFSDPFFKAGTGCLAALCLLCCALACLATWYFGTLLSGFPFRRDTSPRPALVFSPDTLPVARVGTSYETVISLSQNVTPAGQFYLSEGDELPPGLSLGELNPSKDSVTISGTPEQAGTYMFTVNVWCYGTSVSGQRGSKEYTIVVNP